MIEFVTGMLIGIASMGFMAQAGWIDDTENHKTIVEHGCGEYNSSTSKFQWVQKEK